MDRATEIWLKKYPPALQERVKKQWAKEDKYVNDDSVPPLYGSVKSRTDLHDPDLAIDIAKFDFLNACSEGDLPAVKRILGRFKDEYVPSILNCTDSEGFSGLDYSVMYLFPEVEQYLLSQGAVETKKTASVRAKTAKNLKELKEDMKHSALGGSTQQSTINLPRGKKPVPESRLDQ